MSVSDGVKLLVSLVAVSAFFLGLTIGQIHGAQMMRREAVLHGAAKYVANPDTGAVEMLWIGSTQLEKQ